MTQFWNKPFEIRGPNLDLICVPERAVLKNPIEWTDSKGVQFGRIIVGFSVGGKPRWTLKDLEDEWHAFAKAANFAPDVTIVPQRGAFTGRNKKVVREDGATLTVLNLGNETTLHFNNTLKYFAEHLAERFQQEVVIVQLGRGNRVHTTYGMRPFNDKELERAMRRRNYIFNRKKKR